MLRQGPQSDGMNTSITTVVFDVNETLSDLSPLGERFTDVGAPVELAPLWFASVLRDGFALAATGEMREFAAIGKSLLRSLLDPGSLTKSVDDAIEHIMTGFTSLRVHPDVRNGIIALSDAGLRLVTLSNGSSSVADALLTGAGLRDRFEGLLTVEDAGIWKPVRSAYEHAAHSCDAQLAQMLLVAVHPWDLHGAKSAGMQTAWINRKGGTYPDHFTPPDFEVAGLDELPAAL